MNFSIVDLLKRHAFLLLAALVFIGVVAHLFTLPFSPIHWIDEVQICEIARGGIGEKSTDWTIQMCPINDDIDDKILQDVDLCIRDDSRPYEHSTLPERLERNGYVLDAVVCRPKDPPEGSIAAFLKKHHRLFPLGPYYIYRKVKR